MRIIPRNTKVATEFFTGVSVADIVVGFVGVLLIFLVVISNLPNRLFLCGVIASVFVLLLIHIDDEANYMFLLRIVKHFSYHRHYAKVAEVPETEPVAESAGPGCGKKEKKAAKTIKAAKKETKKANKKANKKGTKITNAEEAQG